MLYLSNLLRAGFKNEPSGHAKKARQTRALRAAVENLEGRLFLSASDPDTTFNGTGRVASRLGDGTAYNAVSTLPDGKILAAGRIDVDLGFQVRNYDFVVARYTADGKLDTTFGGGDGWVSTGFPALSSGVSQDVAEAIVQMPGGKFVVVGNRYSNFDRQSDFAIARYNADGSLDTTFSGDGIVTTSFGANTTDVAHAAILTSEGKLLVVGSTDDFGSSHMDVAVARYNANGSLDTSLSGDGLLISNAGTVPGTAKPHISADQAATAVIAMPDGRFAIAGTIRENSEVNAETAKGDGYLSRFSINGVLDTSFGNGKGYVTTGALGSDEAFESLALLSNGKMIAGGNRFTDPGGSGTSVTLLAKYNANGSLDTTFGSNGLQTASFTEYGPASHSINTVLVQPNGKIVAVGASQPQDYEQPTRIALIRYNANGWIDNTFSGNGKQLSNLMDAPAAAALDSQGRIVVAGLITGVAGGVVRFGLDAPATAQISGTIYNDINRNGVKNAGEVGLAGWQAYIDANNDGVYTPGEKIATSGSTGIYHLTGLAPGTYRIYEIRPANWVRSQPAGPYPLGYWEVTVGVGQSVIGKHFGNYKA